MRFLIALILRNAYADMLKVKICKIFWEEFKMETKDLVAIAITTAANVATAIIKIIL